MFYADPGELIDVLCIHQNDDSEMLVQMQITSNTYEQATLPRYAPATMQTTVSFRRMVEPTIKPYG